MRAYDGSFPPDEMLVWGTSRPLALYCLMDREVTRIRAAVGGARRVSKKLKLTGASKPATDGDPPSFPVLPFSASA